MPYSSDIFNADIVDIISALQPRSVCDIGPGAGKYGKILRQQADKMGFYTRITALEIDESYVEKFDLNSIYDEIIIGDAITLLLSPRVRFDLVIMGDCIEHMRKSDAIDLLNFLTYRSAYICVIYPDEYVQDDWEGHAAEAHISIWHKHDFRKMRCLHSKWARSNLCLIRGFQPATAKLGLMQGFGRLSAGKRALRRLRSIILHGKFR
ncbi:class I SAM-dependent methyltransferase [Acidocella sp.]|uniref:class I SAM-dependent methyltransferase n=1 Tax=Acidocella sp. TaxID=50710 RepID=UPI00260FD67B|nr:class I SAM-dependent methyltransferase [Acidocella sp.]